MLSAELVVLLLGFGTRQVSPQWQLQKTVVDVIVGHMRSIAAAVGVAAAAAAAVAESRNPVGTNLVHGRSNEA